MRRYKSTIKTAALWQEGEGGRKLRAREREEYFNKAVREYIALPGREAAKQYARNVTN